MRRGVAAAVVVACVLSCGGANATAPPQTPPPAATTSQLLPYFGSYRTDDGNLLVVARLAWFFDTKSAAYRTIYASSARDHFTIGFRFEEPLPKFADLTFKSDELRVVASGRTTIARRVRNQQSDVSIPANEAQLAGTITEPQGVGPHPGIVIIHGAERGQRYFYDIWVGLYTSFGLTVLTYDKRGIGSSTGQYPGEAPTESALTTYAGDASAALNFLAHWPLVDPRRVGFHGGSQGGWTVPLAISRHPQAAFAILISAPATTVDQTDLWAGFSGGGAQLPTKSLTEMLTEVRDTHSGYDPAPAIASLAVPTLWLLGANDRTVPTTICVEILTRMNKANINLHLLPTGHGLLVNSTGLVADDNHSPGLAPDLVPILGGWLQENVHQAA